MVGVMRRGVMSISSVLNLQLAWLCQLHQKERVKEEWSLTEHTDVWKDSTETAAFTPTAECQDGLWQADTNTL